MGADAKPSDEIITFTAKIEFPEVMEVFTDLHSNADWQWAFQFYELYPGGQHGVMCPAVQSARLKQFENADGEQISLHSFWHGKPTELEVRAFLMHPWLLAPGPWSLTMTTDDDD